MAAGFAEQHLSESAFTQRRTLFSAVGSPVEAPPPGLGVEVGSAGGGQAPAPDPATGAARVENPESTEAEQRIILVIGREEGFSPKLMRHALNMALRNGCGLLALNIIPVSGHFFAILSENAQELVVEAARTSAEPFRSLAESKGVPFTHLARIGKVDTVIQDVHEENKLIHFILSDPDQTSQGGDQQTSIPVFCINRN